MSEHEWGSTRGGAGWNGGGKLGTEGQASGWQMPARPGLTCAGHTAAVRQFLWPDAEQGNNVSLRKCRMSLEPSLWSLGMDHGRRKIPDANFKADVALYSQRRSDDDDQSALPARWASPRGAVVHYVLAKLGVSRKRRAP